MLRFVPKTCHQSNSFAFNRPMALSTNEHRASSEYSVFRHIVEFYRISGRHNIFCFHYILNHTMCTIRAAFSYTRKQLICILQRNFCMSFSLFSYFLLLSVNLPFAVYSVFHHRLYFWLRRRSFLFHITFHDLFDHI